MKGAQVSGNLRARPSAASQPTSEPSVGETPKRQYTRVGVAWNDRDAVNAYKRQKQAEWRKRNPDRYRAAVKRWRFNAKLRECGLTTTELATRGVVPQ